MVSELRTARRATTDIVAVGLYNEPDGVYLPSILYYAEAIPVP